MEIQYIVPVVSRREYSGLVVQAKAGSKRPTVRITTVLRVRVLVFACYYRTSTSTILVAALRFSLRCSAAAQL